MNFERIFRIDLQRFDESGCSAEGDYLPDLLEMFEREFHSYFRPVIANYLFASAATLQALRRSYETEEHEYFGMELINGVIDFEASLEMDKYSQTQTVYAIGSSVSTGEEEPLYLIIDDTLTDGTMILRYLPDEDDDDSLPQPESVDDKCLHRKP
jgi:hypothetical protein